MRCIFREDDVPGELTRCEPEGEVWNIIELEFGMDPTEVNRTRSIVCTGTCGHFSGKYKLISHRWHRLYMQCFQLQGYTLNWVCLVNRLDFYGMFTLTFLNTHFLPLLKKKIYPHKLLQNLYCHHHDNIKRTKFFHVDFNIQSISISVFFCLFSILNQYWIKLLNAKEIY